MRRREFIGVAASGIVSLAAAKAPQMERPRRRPNMIYAFSDEHRRQATSLAGMAGLRTPQMERMAANGIEFTHCISNYPVCSPHRAILMSGRWPHQQGVIDNNIPLSPHGPALGKIFREAGYRTGYIGKWHLGGTRAEPFGFEHSLIWTETNTHYDASRYHPAGEDPVKPKGYNATLMTDQALEYIEAQRDEPFFLMLSWNPPHSNFLDAPEAKQALYPDGSLAYPPNAPAPKPGVSEEEQIWDKNSRPQYRGYHAHVSAIDDELGRVLDGVERLGLAEDTIIIYSSDHGSMLGSHGVGSKRQPFEESIRVPFLAQWPGVIPAGVKSDALMGTVDIMPTLCGLAGLPAPDSCTGLDFSPWFRGEKGPDPDSQFIMHISKDHASGGQKHPAPIFRGVRTKRHTYAVYPDRAWCLFDNEKDPYQQMNLIDDPAHAELRGQLHAETEAWMRRAEDPMPMPG